MVFFPDQRLPGASSGHSARPAGDLVI
jgi:hypothetical protein